MNKYIAEMFGTFWLVFGGCGSAVLAATFPDVGIGLVDVSLAFGLTVVTMAKRVLMSVPVLLQMDLLNIHRAVFL